jgi:hypothetical protein
MISQQMGEMGVDPKGGRLQAFLERSYERLGVRYLWSLFAVAGLFSQLFGWGTLVVISRYLDLSHRD